MTADDIRDIRRRLGLTQAAFALRLNETVPGLNVQQPHVARWESGRVKPSGVIVAAIRAISSHARPAMPIYRASQSATEG